MGRVKSRRGYCTSITMLVAALMVSSAYGGNFYQEFEPTFGGNRVKMHGPGQLLSLTLDRISGSGFQSKQEYLFGRIDMQLKLVPGNSAGTVTAYYASDSDPFYFTLSSQGPTHDEIDFEFLGNVSGQPYTLHTNVYTQGKGNREQQFRLWFDPTNNFHTYSVVWYPRLIIFLADNTPIRVFRNHEAIGVPFPKNQPMRIYSSLWNADDWATQGGLIKTDWTKAPFTAFYRNFNAYACIWNGRSSSCPAASTRSFTNAAWHWQTQNIDLDAISRRRLRWVQRYYMIYNYCTDFKRFPQGIPPECKRSAL